MGDTAAPWPDAVLLGCAHALGDTDHGLTGSEITDLLQRLQMRDEQPTGTKWKRLDAAFRARQRLDNNPRRLVTFITWAMQPALYVSRPAVFAWRRDHLNEVLTFVGLRVNDKGEVARGAASSTLSEAARHANALHLELLRREVHPAVLASCTTEVLQRNAFHASLEAVKSVFARLRELTGLQGDGAAVAQKTLSLGKTGQPVLAVNSLDTESERDEQTGLMNLLIGLFGMYRNPVAHDPRAQREVTDPELLELLTTLSMVHRRLDNAHLT